MLEIILLIFLTRRIGEIVEEKGRKTIWFKVLTVALWIGGEITGAIIGAIVAAVSGVSDILIYVFALLGAAVGAGIAFIIAKSVSPLTYIAPPPPPPTFS
jgi:hypothetical protein